MKLKIVKKYNKTSFICPECGKKQTSILQWQTVSMPYEYDFETHNWESGDPEGGDFEAWCCPECKTDIAIPDKMSKNIL